MKILNQFHNLLWNPLNVSVGKSRLIIHLFHQLRQVLENNPKYYVSTEDDIGDKIITIAFMPLHRILQSVVNGLEILWAIPGFANYFLSDELFLSRVMLDRKTRGVPALSQEEEETIEQTIVWFQTEEEVLKQELKMPGMFLPPTYCGLISKVLVSSCLDLENQSIRDNDLCRAVVRSIFQSWACPYARVSYPSLPCEQEEEENDIHPWPFQQRNYFVTLLIEHIVLKKEVSTKAEEIVPGLTAKQLIEAILNDRSFAINGNRRCIKNFIHFINFHDHQDTVKGVMRSLTPKNRLDLLRILTDKYVGKPVPSQDVYDIMQEFMFSLIGRRSEKMIFQVYDAMTNEPPASIVDDLRKLIRNTRDGKLKRIEPNVTLFIQYLEKKVNKYMLESNQEEQHLPDELVAKICEFAVDQTPPRTCTCGMHLFSKA
jgi:hypothetical protein